MHGQYKAVLSVQALNEAVRKREGISHSYNYDFYMDIFFYWGK